MCIRNPKETIPVEMERASAAMVAVEKLSMMSGGLGVARGAVSTFAADDDPPEVIHVQEVTDGE